MPSNDRQTVILPVRLGPARNYDRAIFPLARFKGTGLLQKGDLLLQATMDEMYNIREMSKGLDSSCTVLQGSKRRYDELADERAKLEDLRGQKLYNPFKLYSRFRATQIFFNATERLYTVTWTTSEKMRRACLSVVSLALVDTPAPEDPIAEDEQIEGIFIDIDGPVNQQTASVLAEMQGVFEVSGNPPADASPSRGEDIAMNQATESTTDSVETLSSVRSGVSSPTSPRSAGIGVSNFHYHNYNASVHNYSSTASGINVNNGISNNDNSVHNQVFLPDPLP
ncbi:hypothetical protein PAXINDRAFT_167042 [Paxillus involutus ATCC 200175]|nr:hypothetical protein PAXINDRAFT_167042 [Paxillus involutus ATCC 200175]